MPKFKDRECDVCKTVFTPNHHSNIICSDECRKKRKREVDRRRNKQLRETRTKKSYYQRKLKAEEQVSTRRPYEPGEACNPWVNRQYRY